MEAVESYGAALIAVHVKIPVEFSILKHVFHHTAAACDAMIGFIFITIIAVVNYQKGNLRRGGREFSMSLENFFRRLTTGFCSSRTTIGDYLQIFLKLSGID